MRVNEKVHQPPLNITEAAAYCGTSPRHIRRLVAERRITFFKLGSTSIRFNPPDLDEWLEAQPKYEAKRPSAAPTRVTRPLTVKKIAKGSKGDS
jgi:excisionase family DNA binding protein